MIQYSHFSQLTKIIIFVFCTFQLSLATCPWGRDPLAVTLQATCICSVNPETGGALSVQCQATNFEVSHLQVKDVYLAKVKYAKF